MHKLRLFTTITILAVSLVILVSACNNGDEARLVKEGDTVRVHYTGTLEDGTEFDSSKGGDPLEFTVGGGQMIKGFDEAIIGMKVGESKTVTIPPEEAYGEYNDDLVIEIDRSELGDIEPEVGMQLQGTTTSGTINYTVIALTDTKVTLDANHPLAGKTLIFEIELVEIL